MPTRSVTAALVLLTAILFAAVMVRRGAGHDYIQFHAAATLLAAGESPYGRDGQVREQCALRGGIDLRDVEPDDLYAEIGILPYFYPPWVALAVVPLTFLNYPVAKALWIYLGSQALVIAGYFLSNRTTLRRHRPALTTAFALGFMPALSAVEIGQVAPLVLLLLVLLLCSIESDQDLAAGFVLAWLTVKPQLSVVAIPATLVWASRRGRWKVVASFAGSLAMLAIGSAAILPDWPLRMIAATREFPLPTAIDPSVGVTWLTFCQTMGIKGRALVFAYATGAVPAIWWTLRAAWDRKTPAAEAIGRGVFAAFFVAPYALGYDLTTLVFPVMVVESKLSTRGRIALIGIAMVVPHWTLSAVQTGVPQIILFWMPLALAALWIYAERRRVSRLTPRPA